MLLLASWPAHASPSPEVQLCLQHLRPSERAKVASALGPWDALPLYRMQLEYDAASHTLQGRVQLQYQARTRTLTELPLRVTANAFGAGRVRLSNLTVNGQAAPLEHPQPGMYRVPLDPAVPVGAAAVLEMQVRAVVPVAPPGADSLLTADLDAPSTDHGAYLASPDAVSLIGALPQVPALDEQGHRIAAPTGTGDLGLYEPANVLASVTVPRGWRVEATGVPLGEVPEPDGRVQFTYGAAAVRDFPLVLVRRAEVATAKVDEVTIESVFRTEHAAQGRKALDHAVHAVQEFQKRFGPLPYTRFRVVEAPLTGGAGGMEFPGFITVASGLYAGAQDPLGTLGGPNAELLKSLLQLQGIGAQALPNVTPMFDQLLEFTVAHEVAHQYFAGLVGSDPINEPVVDETLAQAAALLYIEWRHGPKVASQLRQAQLVTAYQLYRLRGGADGPADRPTGSFGSGIEYAALVYGKAPLLHLEERKLLGEERFIAGVRA